jgi:aminoglycoside phosphotransferase (APT) family kinase protein
MTSTHPPPLVDAGSLGAYLAEQLGVETPIRVTRHRAGHSNETFFVGCGDRRLVLRRPPRGVFLPTAHDVGREYRVTSALEGTPVRVPRTVLMCKDESVIGAPFYLMERIDGVVVRDELPEVFGRDDRHGIGMDLVDALVELHAVDPASCGLDGFGRPSGYLERQLRRWRGQLELTIPHSRPLPELEKVGSWLAAHVPPTQATTVVHGDYKLDNVMLGRDRPGRIVAILDWEMSTLGDPLADVGWMLSSWRDQGDDRTGVFAQLNRVTQLPGFPARAELAERYAHHTGYDLAGISWYEVLALYKLAVLLEGSYARHLAGATDDPFFARLDEGVPELACRALALSEL